MQTIEKAKRPELWKKYRVTATPTIVLIDNATRREVIFQGVKDEKALDALLDAVRKEPK